MNTYTRMGLHDVAKALDGLPRLNDRQLQAQVMQATGTTDARAKAPANLPHNRGTKRHDTMRRGATKASTQRGDDNSE